MEKTKKSVGLVGIGYWGRNILRNLYEMAALHACCDSDPEVLASLQRKYPDVDWRPSFSDLLRDPQVRAMAIATPASTHYSLTRP